MIQEEIHIGSLQKKIVVQIQGAPGPSLFSSLLNICYITLKKTQSYRIYWVLWVLHCAHKFTVIKLWESNAFS